jgi:hypothetical protein
MGNGIIIEIESEVWRLESAHILNQIGFKRMRREREQPSSFLLNQYNHTCKSGQSEKRCQAMMNKLVI